MEIGLNLVAAYEKETSLVYGRDVLSVSPESYLEQLRAAAYGAFVLAVEMAYATKETAARLVGNAFLAAKHLAEKCNIPVENAGTAAAGAAESEFKDEAAAEKARRDSISHEDAEKLSEELKKKGIDVIYFSDMNRTRQTAEIANKYLGAEIIMDKRLRDVNLGVYHGVKKKEFFKLFPKTMDNFYGRKPEGGENWGEVRKRMMDFLNDIDKKHKNKTILLTCLFCKSLISQNHLCILHTKHFNLN